MRIAVIGLAAFVAALLVGTRTSAQTQSLSLSLIERYLESLRIEAGIPGLSVSVLQNGEAVWERGFGRQDLEAAVPASASTPYVIGELSQTIGAALVLKKCVWEGTAELFDPVARWAPLFPDHSATLRDVLTHRAPVAGFRYDPARFASLTTVVETCTGRPYTQVLANDVFGLYGMAQSVPGHSLAAFAPEELAAFGQMYLTRYTDTLARLAVPYRVDPRSRSASRTAVPILRADAATGIVTTVQDLGRLDAALEDYRLLAPAMRAQAWTQAAPLPTGLGWFVQTYNGEPIAWQFGMVKDAYSSLLLKVPQRGITVILLANSDGLTAPFELERGDVTASIFARLFLRLLVG